MSGIEWCTIRHDGYSWVVETQADGEWWGYEIGRTRTRWGAERVARRHQRGLAKRRNPEVMGG